MSSCCGGASGVPQTPDPNKRVNYTFGLVLGVDEFVQEQTYFLEKHRRHDRLLHGYGTVAGLDVTLDTSTGATMIRISPGSAVTPIGQEICVPSAMCCTVETWLAQNAADLKAIFPSGPFPLSLSVCVVLCYRECPTDTVPVPGEPCRTQDNAMAASRIADSFELKLCLNATKEGWKALESGSQPLTPPANAGICLYRPSQVEEVAVRMFGDLLERIEVTEDAVDFLDSPAFEALILAIPAAAIAAEAVPRLIDTLPPVEPPAGPLYLRPEDAQSVLRAGLETWVTQVRPILLNPVSGAPCDAPAEKCVLLAELEVPVTEAFALADVVAMDQISRPWLLDTRLLQEMMLSRLGAADWRDTRTFVTAWVVPTDTVRAWIHHPVPLDIPRAAVKLTSYEVPPQDIAFTLTAAIPAVNVFDLTIEGGIPPGTRYKITFDAEQIQEATSLPLKLADKLDDPNFNYLDRFGTQLCGYAEYAYATMRPGDAASGDLTGTYPGPTIAKLQGNVVAAAAPANLQVLTWTDAAKNWHPADVPSPVLVPATKDVSGTYPALTVVGLQQRPVANTAPANGQVLEWTGANWAPADLPKPSTDFVLAPSGVYAIVAAGLFDAKLTAQFQTYGGLKLTMNPKIPSRLLLRFPNYVMPTAAGGFSYIVKALPALGLEATMQIRFDSFTKTGIQLGIQGLLTGIMIEISQIGKNAKVG